MRHAVNQERWRVHADEKVEGWIGVGTKTRERRTPGRQDVETGGVKAWRRARDRHGEGGRGHSERFLGTRGGEQGTLATDNNLLVETIKSV
eukprot:280117-Pleurochrysis_carterae.AAC.1